jgi:hypothetical protein
MERTGRKNPQDEKIERALQQVGGFRHVPNLTWEL